MLTIVLFAGCDSDKPTANDSIDLASIPYNDEAQDMALFYSNELYPPTALTRRISRELEILRSEWSDSIESVRYNTFHTPWQSHAVEVLCDSVTEASILSGSNETWNNMLDAYNLSVTTWDLLTGKLFFLHPPEALNPNLLAENISKLNITGITWISPVQRGHPFRANIARLENGNSTKYFLMSSACPDLWNRYDYLEITKHRVVYHGTFRECPEDSVQAQLWGLPWQEFETVMDSLFTNIEANRPKWADTARREISEIERALIYQWGSF